MIGSRLPLLPITWCAEQGPDQEDFPGIGGRAVAGDDPIFAAVSATGGRLRLEVMSDLGDAKSLLWSQHQADLPCQGWLAEGPPRARIVHCG